METALLVVQIIADIFLHGSINLTSNVTFLKLFLLVICLHMNLMYWRQNTDLDIT